MADHVWHITRRSDVSTVTYVPLMDLTGYVGEGATVAVAIVISVTPRRHTRHVGRKVFPEHSQYVPRATLTHVILELKVLLLLLLLVFFNDHRQTATATATRQQHTEEEEERPPYGDGPPDLRARPAIPSARGGCPEVGLAISCRDTGEETA